MADPVQPPTQPDGSQGPAYFEKNTVRIDGADYDVETLPNVAKIAIEHLVAIDKEVQRLEMARAGFAQAIKAVMDSDEAPEPVGGEKNSLKPPASKVGKSTSKADLKIVPEPG
jgi:hypothetical protein